jgi:energy-coupling factor transport system ATP-binding protein
LYKRDIKKYKNQKFFDISRLLLYTTPKRFQEKEEKILISIQNVSFNYQSEKNEKETLKNINLEMRKGDFICILGRNGSGKSTLAKLINGLLIPSEGKVFVNGLDVSENLWKTRQSVGMVFQNPDNQIVASVVEEDIAFGPENLGLPREEIAARIDEALNAVGMIEYKKSPTASLSGGQKQRAAIAGILAMKPQCIIFDESTSMLDPEGRAEVLRAAQKLNAEGITIILITHYMEEAVISNRIIVMNDGEIAADGTPREIFSEVEKIKSFSLDLPPMSELAFELRNLGMSVKRDILTIEEMAEFLCSKQN